MNRMDETTQEIERLSVKLADLQAENRYLRKRVKINDKSGRILRRAHRDALYMLTLHFSGYELSRRQALSLAEISERRWEWARALLILASIHDGTTITVQTPQDALLRVKEAVASVERQGLDRLRVRKAHRDRLRTPQVNAPKEQTIFFTQNGNESGNGTGNEMRGNR
jgi:hypothetical protein